jgi:hypothetical protein
VLAPHKPVLPFAPQPWKPHKPLVPRSMIGGLWMIDANFKSTIYLKNYVHISPITVTPVLYLSNGKNFTLPDVILEPDGTATININEALGKQGIAPWATLSGYVQIKYQWPWDALCVMVRDVDVVHSLIYTYFLRSFPQTLTSTGPGNTQESHHAEGMWWKQEAEVSGFLALANPTNDAVQAQVEITDDQANVLGQHTVTVSPHGTKMWTVPELQYAKSSQGGIRVSYNGPEFSIFVSGGLQDQSVGYSANIPFISSPPTANDSKPLSFSELGLMTGAADPMLSFPAGTTFTPYSLVHNVSDWPISVTPSLYWMRAGAPRSFRPSAFPLGPHQTISLDVPSLLAQSGLKDFNGTFNLILDVPGNSRGLLMASGSVDRSNTYVFEVLPRGVSETMAQGISYWSIANGDDTMVTLWNPADEAQDFIVNFFFSGGHYEYPIHLGPRVTLNFNVSEIVHNQLPDREGNVIPPTVHEGSIEISGAQGIAEEILLAGAAATYNIQKATCGGECYQCSQTVMDAFLGITPFSVVASTQLQLTCTETIKGGHQLSCTSGATWSSSNTKVATVSAGLVTGVSAGSVAMGATTAPTNTGDGSYCEDPPTYCPEAPFQATGAAGSVTPLPTVSFSTISSIAVGQTATTTATVSPSSNTAPISLSITSPAAIVSPTGTFTNTTAVVVKGMSAGTATITATVPNSDGVNPTVGSTSFQVVAPTISGISPAQGLVGTAINVTVSGSGFLSGSTVSAGPNISVTNVNVTSSSQITATFTPTNSSSAGGNQAVTVTSGGQATNSTNFYVQVPTHFQRVSVPGAPGGLGPVITVTNGNVVNLSGTVLASNFCGVYENFAYEFTDQQTNLILNGTATVTEVFSNITNPPGPTPSINTVNFATEGDTDTQAYGFTYPTCLANNQNQSLDYSYTITVGSTVYPLVTLINITKGNFNGTLNVTSTITTP